MLSYIKVKGNKNIHKLFSVIWKALVIWLKHLNILHLEEGWFLLLPLYKLTEIMVSWDEDKHTQS